jgi:hypothetical protein
VGIPIKRKVGYLVHGGIFWLDSRETYPPAVPLWVLFVAVQLVDFAWAVFIITGIEHARFVPGFAAASHLDLYHMPYTHSLVAAIIWSVGFGFFYYIWKRRAGALISAIIIGLAVFSHWLADLIVHVPDLSLISGDPKLGFGLWRYFWLSQSIEIGLLFLGLLAYVWTSKPCTAFGRFAPWLFFILLVGVQAISHLPPSNPVPTMTVFATQALGAFSVLALLAWLTERTRVA